MFFPMPVTSDMLETMNDASAADARDGCDFCDVPPNIINSMVCEIQAWRTLHPELKFIPGPNVLKPIEQLD